MIVWWVLMLVIHKVHSWSAEERMMTPQSLKHVDEMKNVAEWGDAQHRGDKWYDQGKTSVEDSDLDSEGQSDSSSVSTSSISTSDSSEASSVETKERRTATKAFRTCTSCPHDMMKSFKNAGIKWICAGYQRARRSFKSECMMRYRNCQDGTLFVKIYDHRCRNDTYHGKHWFYVYKT